MRRRVVPLLVALALTGCSGSHTTQAESAGGAADTFVKTCAAGRPAAALELLTTPAKDAFARAPSALQGCLDLLGIRSPAALTGTRVGSVHANDLSATAEVVAPDGSRSFLRLEKSRGEWSVTSAR